MQSLPRELKTAQQQKRDNMSQMLLGMSIAVLGFALTMLGTS